ncbi:hypothetical protein ABGF48_03235 [Helcococcus bovis]
MEYSLIDLIEEYQKLAGEKLLLAIENKALKKEIEELKNKNGEKK